MRNFGGKMPPSVIIEAAPMMSSALENQILTSAWIMKLYSHFTENRKEQESFFLPGFSLPHFKCFLHIILSLQVHFSYFKQIHACSNGFFFIVQIHSNSAYIFLIQALLNQFLLCHWHFIVFQLCKHKQQQKVTVGKWIISQLHKIWPRSWYVIYPFSIQFQFKGYSFHNKNLIQ